MRFRQLFAAVVPFTMLAACTTDTLVNDKVYTTSPGCGGDPAELTSFLVESYLPVPAGQALRVRVDGRYLILGPENPEYLEIHQPGQGVGAEALPGEHTIELVDRDGRIWTTIPVTVPRNELWASRPWHTTMIWVYGDPASPSYLVGDGTEHDTSLDTTEVTLRNGTPTGESIIVSRCVNSGVVGEPAVCEDLATVAHGETWSATLANSRVSFPFGGEAYVALRLVGEPIERSGWAVNINQHPEDPPGYTSGCQAAAVLVFDVFTNVCDGLRTPVSRSDC